MNKKWLMALSASLLLISCSGGNPTSSETSSLDSTSEQASASGESSSEESSKETSSESSIDSSSESSSEDVVGDENFALSDDKQYFTLIKCPDSFASDYAVPSAYKGLSVKAIAKTAFASAPLIVKLTIPSTVAFIEKRTLSPIAASLSTLITPFVGQSTDEEGAYIGEMFGIGDVTGKNKTSYYASGFKSLTITNQKKLPDGVLAGCDTLEEIIIENCEELGTGSVKDLEKLKTISLPDGLLKIGVGALGSNPSLTSLSIPDSVTTIEGQAFVDLPFETFILPKSLQNFTYYQDMPQLKTWVISEENAYFKVEDGILYSKDETLLINFPQAKDATGFALKEITTSIGQYAFFMTNVPTQDFSHLTSIGSYAFYACSSIKEAHFGSKLSHLGSSAFYATGISSLDFAASLDEGVEFETANMVFAACSALESVALPGYITAIEDSWFASCSKLSSVTTSGNLTYLGINAFAHSAIASIELTFNDKAEIKSGVFTDTPLNEFTLHFAEGVSTYPTVPSTGIGATPSITVDSEEIASALKQAWNNCPNLAALIKTKDVISEEFVIEDGTLVRYDISKSSDPTRIVIPDVVTTIATGVFTSLTQAQYVYIPSSVTTIENWAFKSSTNILEIEFGHDDPSSVITSYRQLGIGDYTRTVFALKDISKADAFKNAAGGKMYENKLKVASADDLSIDYDRKEIYSADKTILYAYAGSDESYSFIDSVKEVAKCAFIANTTIKNIAWNNVEKIDDNAFQYCVISEIALGEKVVFIGNSAFANSTGLESISIQGAASIGDYAFYGSEDDSAYTVTSLDLGNKVKSIGSNAFTYIIGEVEVLIPASCTSVDTCAFDYFSDSEDASIYFAGALSTYRSEANSYWDEDDCWLDDFLSAARDNNEITVAFYSETTPSEEEQGFDCSYWYYDEAGEKTLY